MCSKSSGRRCNCRKSESEIRNPKQTQNPNEKFSKHFGSARFGHWPFVFPICFVFRHSNFGFPLTPAMTTPILSCPGRSPGIPGQTPGLGPGGRCLGRADALGTGGIAQSLATKERGGRLGPRGLASRTARRRAAATLPRDCRPLGRLERLSGRGRRGSLPLPGQRRQVPRLAIDLPSQRRLRFLRSGEEEFLLPCRTARCSICKAAGSTRRASARETSTRWMSKSATARRSG